ncbi:hypothetical protein FMEAI12_3250009 [Parafrankia sp. Ea1.12]|nr:hypothetical protein FMEAI12_3250009 [Parafrankia sp. Ea1.12]
MARNRHVAGRLSLLSSDCRGASSGRCRVFVSLRPAVSNVARGEHFGGSLRVNVILR